MEGHEIKNQKMQSLSGKGKLTMIEKKTHKNNLGLQGIPREPWLCVEKECFELYHTQFDSSV